MAEVKLTSLSMGHGKVRGLSLLLDRTCSFFDIRVLTPDGVEIDLPFQVFKQLKKLHLLERDRITGKRKIKKRALQGVPAGGCFAHLCALADWRTVYREERRNPGYVIENGRMPNPTAAVPQRNESGNNDGKV